MWLGMHSSRTVQTYNSYGGLRASGIAVTISTVVGTEWARHLTWGARTAGCVPSARSSNPGPGESQKFSLVLIIAAPERLH